MQRALAATSFALVTLVAPAARAHPSEPCRLELSFRPDAVDATLHLPVDDLGLALAATWGDESLRDLVSHPERFDAAFAQRLRDYVARHVELRDERGVVFEEQVGPPRWIPEREAPFVVVPIRLAPPRDHAPSALHLRADTVTHEVVTQRTLVFVTHDFERADLDGSERVIAVVRRGDGDLTFDRRDASVWRGAAAMLELGARHIAEGIDHLLFVFVLLLAAPLEPSEGSWWQRRWAAPRSLRATLRRLFVVVTAFTLGHSITLALGASGALPPSATLVEVLVGASIAIGAVNAIRPLFGAREALIGGGFGLVHGLAFAETLRDIGLRDAELVISLAGFNLGIEAVQLGMGLVVAPLLVVAARGPGYAALRGLAATGALVASGAWVLERITATPNALSAALERAALSPESTSVALVGSLVLWVVAARSSYLLRRRLSSSGRWLRSLALRCGFGSIDAPPFDHSPGLDLCTDSQTIDSRPGLGRRIKRESV
ncbi:MAG: HupE/UreJ family protein [Sandaracinaceae bacterium]|nr:HupE/UreJ family protein [Sandaracinaceae bacterium]